VAQFTVKDLVTTDAASIHSKSLNTKTAVRKQSTSRVTGAVAPRPGAPTPNSAAKRTRLTGPINASASMAVRVKALEKSLNNVKESIEALRMVKSVLLSLVYRFRSILWRLLSLLALDVSL
jgi:hypothetical protein